MNKNRFDEITDKQLKSMKPIDRQSFIIDNLNLLRDYKVNPDPKVTRLDVQDMKKCVTQVLKAYLFEKGESVDIDFCSKFSERINSCFSGYNRRDLEKFLDNMDHNIELPKGVELIVNKFKLSNEEATKIFKSYHGIGE